MERLTKKELRALLECIKECYPICDIETFAQRVVSRLSKIVPTEIISYNGRNLRIAGKCSFDLPARCLRGRRTFRHRLLCPARLILSAFCLTCAPNKHIHSGSFTVNTYLAYVTYPD